jgi:hypothetical protein
MQAAAHTLSELPENFVEDPRIVKNVFAPILVTAVALPLAAHAAAPLPHIRGVVSGVTADTLTVQTDDGKHVNVKLTGTTHYVEVKKSSLSAIDSNTFIGTATKNVGSQLVALEVVVFPNSMRGTGEGHYSWDPLPDTTLGGGKTHAVASTMTNGTVTMETGGGATKVNSTMTNGTVTADNSAGGVKQLVVTYKGGEQHILVPPTAPIVTLAPGSMTDVKPGEAVVVTDAKDSDAAVSVAVGVDGVKPPM